MYLYVVPSTYGPTLLCVFVRRKRYCRSGRVVLDGPQTRLLSWSTVEQILYVLKQKNDIKLLEATIIETRVQMDIKDARTANLRKNKGRRFEILERSWIGNNIIKSCLKSVREYKRNI